MYLTDPANSFDSTVLFPNDGNRPQFDCVGEVDIEGLVVAECWDAGSGQGFDF